MSGIILLTAAVTPNPLYQAAVSDAGIRLGQYQNALANWTRQATRIGWRTAVVETTGFPASGLLEGIPNINQEQISVVSFEPDPEIIARGKGAVEAAAIDAVLTNPGLDLDPSLTLYKSTGRLILRNGDQLLAKIRNNAITIRRSLDRRYCDTRFFGTTVGFWNKQLSGMAEEVDDDGGRYLEHVLAHRILDSEYQGCVTINRFHQRPLIVGQSGTTGSRYGSSQALLKARVLASMENFLAKKLSSKQV